MARRGPSVRPTPSLGGELERAVMNRLWDAEAPLAVREVHALLQPERDVAYTTVMTVMDRLHGKGHLTREMVGRAWMYSPTESRAAYQARLMNDVLVAADDPRAALTHFVEQMSRAELTALRELVTDPHVRRIRRTGAQ